jgi:hypothetical protein
MEKLNNVLTSFFALPVDIVQPNGRTVTKNGHICLMVSKPTASRKTYRYAVSFKSPMDVPDPKLGLKIAHGRLVSKRKLCQFRYDLSLKKSETSEKDKEAFFLKFLKDFWETRTRQARYRGKLIETCAAPEWMVLGFNQGHDFKFLADLSRR